MINTRRFVPVLAAALVAVTGCGSSRSQNEASQDTRSMRNPRVFTLEDIQNAQSQNINSVLDMVRRYRSEWLRPTLVSNSGRTAEPNAYMDRVRIGTWQALQNVPLASATMIRYLPPFEAQGELGLDNLGGAIVVSTR